MSAIQQLLASYGGTTSAWTPADISNIVHYWNANSLTLSDGDPVATWNDEVGTSNLTAVGAARPTYQSNSGTPYVGFDGIANVMSAVITSLTDFCIVMVADYPTDDVGWPLATNGGVGIKRNSIFEYGAMSNYGAQINMTTFSSPADKVVLYERIGSVIRTRNNGAEQTNGSGDTTASGSPLFLGEAFGAGFIEININEITICNGGLSAGDETSYAAYILNTYGLTL